MPEGGLPDIVSHINDYETPNFYKVNKKFKNDTSTIRTEIIQFFPSGGNNESILNTSADIIFQFPGQAGTIIHLGSDRSGIRTRFRMLTGYTGVFVGPTPGQNNPNTTYASQNANITLDSTFWGQMFNKFELSLGGTSGVETIDQFEPYFELMCHMRPLDFKLKSALESGYIPDEFSGAADDSITTSEVALQLQNAAAVAANTAGNYFIWFAYNQSLAIGGVISIQLVNNGSKVNLVSVAALGAYTYGQYYIQATNNSAATIAASGAYTLNIGQGITLNLVAVASVNVGAVGNFYVNYSSPSAVPIAGIVLFPYANGGIVNPNYEPGYLKRKRFFNYPVINDTTWRYFDVFIPLNLISGFCRDFNKLTEMLPITIKLHRNGMMYKSLVGAPGTDCDLRISAMTLELEQIFPNDKLKEEFNKVVEHDIDIAFLSGGVMPFQLTGNAPNSIPTTFSQPISIWTKPDYLFVVFKDGYAVNTPSAQTNASLNLNLDINKIQVMLDGKYYPSIQQDGNFDADEFTPFYQRYKECVDKIWGECTMSPLEYRDLYPIFGFDLNAQLLKLHNQNVSLQLTFTRNGSVANNITGLTSRGTQLTANNTNSNIQIYVIGMFEKYFRANYTKQQLSLIS
jgi:hypothetical protein